MAQPFSAQSIPLTSASDKGCPSCGSFHVRSFYRQSAVPVNSVLNISDRRLALGFPTGDIDLKFCSRCGFVSNYAFDPSLVQYSTGYEATQGFSSTYNSFAARSANTLIERHGLRNKTLLEIGCGDGEFLGLLCESGDNRGIGFDPSFRPQRAPKDDAQRLTFIKDFYSEKYSGFRADFLFCRMTLEHIPDTMAFVSMVRRALGDQTDTAVFFQVPDVTRILRDCAFEDIYYEHCSYFNPGALKRLFRSCGFDVLSVDTDYGGQYVMIEAKAASGEFRPLHGATTDIEMLSVFIDEFESTWKTKRSAWTERIRSLHGQGKKGVIWGSGSKGVSFLTTLDIREEISCAVDINPHRHGMFMAKTGHEIVGPASLDSIRPDYVIAMNSLYTQEIRQALDRMGLSPEILTLD